MTYWRPRTEAQKAAKREYDAKVREERRRLGIKKKPRTPEQNQRRIDLERARRQGITLPPLRPPVDPVPRSEAKTTWGQERARKKGLAIVEPVEHDGRYRSRPAHPVRGKRLKFVEDLSVYSLRRGAATKELYERMRDRQVARGRTIAKRVKLKTTHSTTSAPVDAPMGMRWGNYTHLYACEKTSCVAWSTPTLDNAQGRCLHCGNVLGPGWFRDQEMVR